MQDITNDFTARWNQALIILSLDYVLPFWEYMGLFFSEHTKKQVQSIIRDSYSQCRAAKGKSDYEVQMMYIVQSSLDDIQKCTEKETMATLAFWCNHHITIYNHDAEITNDMWRKEVLGLYYRSLASIKEPNVFSWDEERYTYFAKCIENQLVIPDEQLEEFIQQCQYNEAIHTEWDKFVLNEQVENLFLADLTTLCLFIQSIGRNYNLFRLWQYLENTLTETEIKEIAKWIKYQIAEKYTPKYIKF